MICHSDAPIAFQNFLLSQLRVRAHVEKTSDLLGATLPPMSERKVNVASSASDSVFRMTLAFSDDQQVIGERSGFAPMLLYELSTWSQQQRHKRALEEGIIEG